MFQKILFPTDFSKKSEKVKIELKELSDCNVGEVILLHVIDKRKLSFSSLINKIENNDAIHDKIITHINKILETWKEDLENDGLKVTSVVKEGIPYDEILKLSKEENITSIIIGDVGHNIIEKMLLGSTAEKVLRLAHIPIILIK